MLTKSSFAEYAFSLLAKHSRKEGLFIFILIYMMKSIYIQYFCRWINVLG
jgi:hypothetical protein